jgi:hypothetical protein
MDKKTIHAKLAMSIKDSGTAENYANELNKLGFKIIKISPRGVSFEGPVQLFETTFKSEIETTADGNNFRTEPVLPETLKTHVDSVYFPTKPIFFK